jgi:hypothetical protein
MYLSTHIAQKELGVLPTAHRPIDQNALREQNQKIVGQIQPSGSGAFDYNWAESEDRV